MRETVLTLRKAALLLVLVPVAACAKPGDQTTPAKGKSAMASTGLSLQDFVKRQEQRLMAGDTDGDGKLSQAEFVAAAKSGKGDPARRFAKMDSNGDGMLDKSEIDATLTRRFKRLDTDGDGRVSASERTAAAARKGKAGDGSET